MRRVSELAIEIGLPRYAKGFLFLVFFFFSYLNVRRALYIAKLMEYSIWSEEWYGTFDNGVVDFKDQARLVDIEINQIADFCENPEFWKYDWTNIVEPRENVDISSLFSHIASDFCTL